LIELAQEAEVYVEIMLPAPQEVVPMNFKKLLLRWQSNGADFLA